MPKKPYSLQCFSHFFEIAYLLLYLSERLETLFMISEEHLENGEISFQNVYRYNDSVKSMIRGMLITYCVRDFLFYGYLCMKKENVML